MTKRTLAAMTLLLTALAAWAAEPAVRISDNRIIQARTDTSAIWLSDLVGLKEVKRNDMREVAHVYNYGANFDGSILGTYDGSEVDACGNVTQAGAAQPQACP